MTWSLTETISIAIILTHLLLDGRRRVRLGLGAGHRVLGLDDFAFLNRQLHLLHHLLLLALQLPQPKLHAVDLLLHAGDLGLPVLGVQRGLRYVRVRGRRGEDGAGEWKEEKDKSDRSISSYDRIPPKKKGTMAGGMRMKIKSAVNAASNPPNTPQAKRRKRRAATVPEPPSRA